MNNFHDRLSNLNDRQLQAVNSIEGPVMVVAGPGTGKTELLSLRTANILEISQVSPHNILLLTFTDSAAFNMRERLVGLIGESGYRVSIYTFHSFATEIISRYGEYFFDGASFLPLSDATQKSVIQNILKNSPKVNTLSIFHLELGFVYERDILSNISNLKKANIKPDDLAQMLQNNSETYTRLNDVLNNLQNDFTSISGKRKLEIVLPTYIELYNNLKDLENNDYIKILKSKLDLAIALSQAENSIKPLSNWKDEFLAKVEDGEEVKFVIRDSQKDKVKKLQDFVKIYTEYQNTLYEKGFYDFDDMILLVKEAMAKNTDLRLDLQERFQYIMIDEFQDTNEAQFSIVKELCTNIDKSINIAANVMVVGDDDQAVYKFQGAEIGNIFDFKKTFPSSDVIVLDKNYRSTQNILDLSRDVIKQAKDRLEVRDKNINKDLKSQKNNFTQAKIEHLEFENEISERQFVASKIEELINGGVVPSEIAVICRKHEALQKLSAILSADKIAFSYEKKENILDKQHIKELIKILEFCNLFQHSKGYHLLPELLSAQYLELDAVTSWQIALQIKQDGNSKTEDFLEQMLKHIDMKVQTFAKFLLDMISDSRALPLENLIYKIIEFVYYKQFYLEGDFTDLYTERLLDIKTLIGAIKEFKLGTLVTVDDLKEFLNIYNAESGLVLSSDKKTLSSKNKVQLLTAHKAKGLEFEYVFIFSMNDDIWAGRGYSSKITFPKNIIFGSDKDNDDDKARLLFVALTRAKHNLYLTHSETKVRFLSEYKSESVAINLEKKSITAEIAPMNHSFSEMQKDILHNALHNYSLTFSHLKDFLNFTQGNYIDFIQKNILSFPIEKTVHSIYGTAMHYAAEQIFSFFNSHNTWPEFANIEKIFLQKLSRDYLEESEYRKYAEYGLANLQKYLEYLKNKNIIKNETEVKFVRNSVRLNDVPVSGIIDRLEFDKESIKIIDIKTGNSFDSFQENNLSDTDKVKLHFFKYQLAFYKLLIQNSDKYNNYKVFSGAIEFIDIGENENLKIANLLLEEELTNRVKNLIKIVYNKIVNLDFPDISNYTQNFKGILQFEEDLLNGKI